VACQTFHLENINLTGAFESLGITFHDKTKNRLSFTSSAASGNNLLQSRFRTQLHHYTMLNKTKMFYCKLLY